MQTSRNLDHARRPQHLTIAMLILTTVGSRLKLASALAVVALTAQTFVCVQFSSAQTMHYGLDHQWKHGREMNGSSVPDDYLRPLGAGGEMTRSTPPFGYYASASGRPLYDQHNLYAARDQRFGYTGNGGIVMINKGQVSSRGVHHPSGAWLDGMGGMDYDDDYMLQQYGDDVMNYRRGGGGDPMYYGNGGCYGGGGGYTTTRRRSSGSRPRVIYQTQPTTRYWGMGGRSASIIPGVSGGGYTMSGRSSF